MKSTERFARVNELVKRTLGAIIQRAYPAHRYGMVTISRVIVSKDLQHARVFFTVLGGEEKEEKMRAQLVADQPKIRTQLAHSVRMRYTPELIFEIDRELKHALRLDALIDKAADVTDAHESRERAEGRDDSVSDEDADG